MTNALSYNIRPKYNFLRQIRQERDLNIIFLYPKWELYVDLGQL